MGAICMSPQTPNSLREATLFKSASLNEEEKKQLDQLGLVFKYYPSNTLLTPEEDDLFVLVHAGWGCLYSNVSDGDRQILDFPLNGDLILVSRSTPRGVDETFMALTEIMVWQGPVRGVIEGIANFPKLTSIMMGAALRQKAILIQHMNSLGRRKALSRVAHLLLELGARLERAGAASRDGFRCPLTQYDLADALGLTAIHVNRMLRELRERGLIDFRQRTVRFLDRPGLERVAGFDPDYLKMCI
jgi:cAMP-binding proteins - catabolite gene activator and regulatory subunit of cAMP-dependent protein kinases